MKYGIHAFVPTSDRNLLVCRFEEDKDEVYYYIILTHLPCEEDSVLSRKEKMGKLEMRSFLVFTVTVLADLIPTAA